MSDADNQMGGSGGETGRQPGGEPRSPASQEARDRAEGEGRRSDDDAVNEESEESFPASDPPANY